MTAYDLAQQAMGRLMGAGSALMIFEASFYLNQPMSPEAIMAFAETFGGQLNRMAITDANLRSRSGRPDPGRMAEALAADFPPTHIQLFQKGKDGNNNVPERSLALTRLSIAEDEDRIFSLIANGPVEDEQTMAAAWWDLAGEAGAKAGNGYQLRWPIGDINYAMFAGSEPAVCTPTWEAFDASCHRFILDQASFLPVVEGKMLRNILRQNFMTASLAEAIKDGLQQSGLAIDGFVSCSQNRVVWTLPDPQSQRAIYAALHEMGLVWENDWLDLMAHRPTPSRFGTG